jgi:hypothetical protein
VQDQVVAKYPSAQLRVYVVWLPMLASDARETWDGNTLPDTRVAHFWDGEAQVGKWFAEQVDGYRGVAWDVYYLYGPEATWETVPPSLIDSGGTVYSERERLRQQVITALERE